MPEVSGNPKAVFQCLQGASPTAGTRCSLKSGSAIQGKINSSSNSQRRVELAQGREHERAVIRPVLGFSEGMFSIDSVKRAELLSTSMV